MAFYIVLHHPRDPHQPWANAWCRGTDDEVEAITTTRAIAKRCRQEGTVYVHRCGFDRAPPAVVCELEVTRVDGLGASALVSFRVRRKLRVAPAVVPGPGQNFYEGEDIP
jgi:hypothetical protein